MGKRLTPAGSDDNGAKAPETPPVADTVTVNPYTFPSEKSRQKAVDLAVANKDWQNLPLIADAAIVNPIESALSATTSLVAMLHAALSLDEDLYNALSAADVETAKLADAMLATLGNGGTLVARKAGKTASTGDRERIEKVRDLTLIGDATMSHAGVSGAITYRDGKWIVGRKSYDSPTALVQAFNGKKPVNPWVKLTFSSGPNRGQRVNTVVLAS